MLVSKLYFRHIFFFLFSPLWFIISFLVDCAVYKTRGTRICSSLILFSHGNAKLETFIVTMYSFFVFVVFEESQVYWLFLDLKIMGIILTS